MHKGQEHELQNGDKSVLVQTGKEQIAFIYLEPDVAPQAGPNRSAGLVPSPTGLDDFRQDGEPPAAKDDEDGPSTSPGPPPAQGQPLYCCGCLFMVLPPSLPKVQAG